MTYKINNQTYITGRDLNAKEVRLENSSAFISIVDAILVPNKGNNYGYDASPSSTFRWSFTSDGNASLVGSLTLTRNASAGSSSFTHAYTHGGVLTGVYGQNVIEKTAFTSSANATDVGDLIGDGTAKGYYHYGYETATNGYAMGGYLLNRLNTWPFATDANATNISTGTSGSQNGSFSNEDIHGYRATFNSTTLSRFSFASGATMTTVGTVTNARYSVGTSSYTHGYLMGGHPTTGSTNIIEKFAFGSESTRVDVGDLISPATNGSACSSTTHGYRSGIQKFPFATDANAVQVGTGSGGTAGNQN